METDRTKTEDGTASGNFYDLTITYDPQLVLPTSRNTFSVTSANGCIASIGTDISFMTTNIDFTLGYAINMQGNPYRYANVTIHDFSITKICSSAVVIPAAPVIMSFDTSRRNYYIALLREMKYMPPPITRIEPRM